MRRHAAAGVRAKEDCTAPKCKTNPNSVRLSTCGRVTRVERALATLAGARPCHMRTIMRRTDWPSGTIQMGYYFSVNSTASGDAEVLLVMLRARALPFVVERDLVERAA